MLLCLIPPLLVAFGHQFPEKKRKAGLILAPWIVEWIRGSSKSITTGFGGTSHR